MNGWFPIPSTTTFWKDDFQNPAYATLHPRHVPGDNNSTYATTYNDMNAVKIDGTKTYRLRFEKDERFPR